MNRHRKTRSQVARWATWCLLLLAAWWLWTWRLAASDLTFDEAATYHVAHRPLFSIISYVMQAVREHPPIYYMLVNVWMALAGTSEFSLRLPSAMASMIALVLVGWVARLAAPQKSWWTGFPAAVFLLMIPGMSYYAREARMYTLGVMLTLISTGLFLRDWLLPDRGPTDRAIASLLTVDLVAAGTHYFLILPLLVQPLALLLARRWRPLLSWLLIHASVAIAGAIWLTSAPGVQLTAQGMWNLAGTSLPKAHELQYLLGKLLFSPIVGFSTPMLYAILLMTIAGTIISLRCRTRLGVWLICSLVVPLSLLYILPIPPAPRYVLFSLPSVALALASLTTAPVLPRRIERHRHLIDRLLIGIRGAMAMCIAAILIGGGLLDSVQLIRSRYGHTIKTIHSHARAGDRIIFYGPWQKIQYAYYQMDDMPPILSMPTEAPPRLDPDWAQRVLESVFRHYERVWVLRAAVDDVDPEHYVEAWLGTHTHTVWETQGFTLHLPPLPDEAPEQQVNMTFADRLDLEAVAYEGQIIPAGEPLRLLLYWRLQAPWEGQIRLLLTLIGPDGHIWTTAGAVPGGEGYPVNEWDPGERVTDRAGLTIPQEAPPGRYTVHLSVIDAVTDEFYQTTGDTTEVAILSFQVDQPIHAPIQVDQPDAGLATFQTSGEETAIIQVTDFEPGGTRFQQGHAVPFRVDLLVPTHSVPDAHLQFRLTKCQPFLPRWLPQSLGSDTVATRTVSLRSVMDARDSRELEVDYSHHIALPLVMSSYAAGALTEQPEPPEIRALSLPIVFSLPFDASVGRACATLALLDEQGAPHPSLDGRETVFLFTCEIESRPVARRLFPGLTKAEVTFADEIELRGYAIEGNARPGGQIQIRYAWRAHTHPQAIYAVFNHLVTADGTIVAQADGWPQQGRMLTTQWQPGEYIEDVYKLDIPKEAPAGPYTLLVGMYDAATGERQSAQSEGGRLLNDAFAIPVGEQGRQ